MILIPKIPGVSNLQTTLPLWAFNVAQHRLNVILETHPANTIQHRLEKLPDMIIFEIDSEPSPLN